jgi:hypothetical protein
MREKLLFYVSYKQITKIDKMQLGEVSSTVPSINKYIIHL